MSTVLTSSIRAARSSSADTSSSEDSDILVTGVNSYLGSHIADQLLAAGYNVRGTGRTAEKLKWVAELFDKKYGPGRFEGASVPDTYSMVVDGAFDEAVKGASGILHVASVLTFSAKVDEVVTPTVKGTLEVLRSAAKEPGVKSLVYTSSSSACLLAETDKVIVITEDTWNESAVAEANVNSNPNPVVLYAASKTEAEKAVWQVVERTKPPFQVSAVLPNMNFGPILGDVNRSSSGSFMARLARGEDFDLSIVPPQWFINVVDTARLHVAALIDPSCNGKRIFAFAATYNWNDVLAILRKQNPERKFMEDVPGLGRDLSQVPNQAAEALLQKHYQKGFTGLEETVRENSLAVL
ncbi:NAD-P-binding protein [Mycena vitilis]|nr:NAD-P-binding protein [Mycena vitilis]